MDFKHVTVRAEFANPKYNTVYCFWDILKAVNHARINLEARCHVKLHAWHSSGIVYFDLDIPSDIAETFKVSNHLRGVSAYLLKLNPDKYERAKVGNRLFFYYQIDPNPKELSEKETEFVNLLITTAESMTNKSCVKGIIKIRSKRISNDFADVQAISYVVFDSKERQIFEGSAKFSYDDKMPMFVGANSETTETMLNVYIEDGNKKVII